MYPIEGARHGPARERRGRRGSCGRYTALSMNLFQMLVNDVNFALKVYKMECKGMLDLEEIKQRLTTRKPYYSREYGVSRMAIFGSYSRGEQTQSSDIDIMVEFDRPIGLKFVDLADDLESLLTAKVDLVSKKAIKPRLLSMIERELSYV